MSVIITGGEFRGRRLATDTRAQVIRPTSGKVREALFSSLGGRVPGSSFVDLYAGSGAVGLEALSRGAAEVHLVENHPQSWNLLKANSLSVTGRKGEVPGLHLVHSDAAAFCRDMAARKRNFDILFADPPFDKDRDFSALPGLFRGLLAREGMAIIQFPMRTPPLWVGHASKVKRYGESGLAFFTAGTLSDDASGLPDGA